MVRIRRPRLVPALVGGLLAGGLVGERYGRRRDAAMGSVGRTVEVQGRRCRVVESGPDDGDESLVVLLPGSGDTAESWAAVQDRLNRSRRVLTYDRSGMGGSDAGAESDLQGVVEELNAVLSAVGVASPVVLVSHSFGGLLARVYATTHPERVAGLVLVDATPPVIAEDPGVRTGFLISAGLAKILKALAPFGLTRGLLALRAMPLYPEQRDFNRVVSPTVYRRWVAAVCANFAGNAGHELAAVLPAAAMFQRLVHARPPVPVAVVFSRAYGARWEQMQRDVAAELEAVAVHPTNAKHHNIHMTRPDLVAQAVSEVLAGAQSAGELA